MRKNSLSCYVKYTGIPVYLYTWWGLEVIFLLNVKNRFGVELGILHLIFFRSKNPASEEVRRLTRVIKDAPVSGVFCGWEGV